MFPHFSNCAYFCHDTWNYNKSLNYVRKLFDVVKALDCSHIYVYIYIQHFKGSDS